ncbi:stage V sporulation protein K [Bacillus taeanensis]|uniref:Stage V sporulation protein K n=1 Tax=Bacillus taeanensis TaxID=273032 RepID=A0A366XYU8_9BACI|nr:stage V sporulation protein K [Bacillus taeanensis]RBW69929.1 stage V sporulation protein K [Bacillus taeanensis]
MQDSITQRAKGQINVVLKHNELKHRANEDTLISDMDLEKHYPLEKIQRDMSGLIGMDSIKKVIKEIYAWIYINNCRKDYGLKQDKQALHMVFKGNPGTGKTTVARLIGKLFFEMNVLTKGHLIEAERADLVGEYIGHTAQKTRDLIKKAKGGILFIDEAYSLARGGEKDFGKESIDALVKGMEDFHQDFILILAGYPKEMNRFLELNPGMPSRFPLIIDFPDYSVQELLEIAKKMVAEREYILSTEAERKLKLYIQQYLEDNIHSKSFSNGRFVRNIIEKAIRAQAIRLLRSNVYNKSQLMLLTSEDFSLES